MSPGSLPAPLTGDLPLERDIWNQMTFCREMCRKYGVKLYVSECEEIPGELIYEDAFQIAVKNQPEDAAITTREL